MNKAFLVPCNAFFIQKMICASASPQFVTRQIFTYLTYRFNFESVRRLNRKIRALVFVRMDFYTAMTSSLFTFETIFIIGDASILDASFRDSRDLGYSPLF